MFLQETAESCVVEGHSTMDCVEEEEHITMVLEEQATIIKERQADFEDQLATMDEEQTTTEEQQATVVMRKNEHNEFLTRTSEGPQKPDSLELQEEEQGQENSSGFWTHRSSVISIADSARWNVRCILTSFSSAIKWPISLTFSITSLHVAGALLFSRQAAPQSQSGIS